MNRPTCESCAYWESYDNETKLGQCNKKPIGIEKTSDSFCGEHHLFKKYLESLESKPEHDSYAKKLSE